MFKKVFACVMAAVMLICALSVNSFASVLPDYTMTDSEWEQYWEENKSDNTKISLTPGADESELNFNWHSETKLGIPKIRISQSPDMSDYSEFCGYATPAEKGFQTNRVTVTGLEENTVYYYSYSLGRGDFSDPEIYRTLSKDSFKALYVGDIQCGAGDDGYATRDAANWNKLLSTALKDNDDISFILSCGDQTQNGNNALEWAGTLSPKALRSIPMATTVGNHDKKGYNYQFYVNNPNSYYGTTPSPVGRGYYFRYGDVLFISLNSTQYNVFDHYNLVEQAVAENTDAKWRVIFMHHDIYGTGHHARSDESLLMQAAYSAICDKFDIDVMLTGHEHFYGRSYFMYDNEIVDMDYSTNTVTNPEGTLYLTSSSASGKNRYYDDYVKNSDWVCFDYMTEGMIYSTVEFTDTTFNVSTYDLDNNLIDTYTIVKTEPFSEHAEEDTNLLCDTNAVDRILRNFTGEYYVIFEVIYKIVDVFKNFLSVIIK